MRNKIFTLEEMFAQDTRDMLIRNSRLLGIRIPRSLRKDAMAKRFATTILAHPLQLLKYLPIHEVKKLQQMVHSKDHSVIVQPSYINDCLTEIGVADTWWDGENELDMIYPDLVTALEPVIDKFVDNIDPLSPRYRREQMILGVLNLYGILCFSDLAMLCKSYDNELEGNILHDTLIDSFLIHSRELFTDNDIYFTSPYLFEPEYVLEEIASRSEITPVTFSIEEVMNAGKWMSPILPVNRATNTMKKKLSPFTKSEEEILWYLGQSWILLNNDRDSISLFHELIENNDLTIEALNEMVGTLMEWGNNLPRWILKGNSPSSVFEKFEKPKLKEKPPQIVMGPNAREAGIDFPQEEFNKIWEKVFKDQPHQPAKVGRNDPCPCGSGRKYKRCCGGD